MCSRPELEEESRCRGLSRSSTNYLHMSTYISHIPIYCTYSTGGVGLHGKHIFKNVRTDICSLKGVECIRKHGCHFLSETAPLLFVGEVQYCRVNGLSFNTTYNYCTREALFLKESSHVLLIPYNHFKAANSA